MDEPHSPSTFKQSPSPPPLPPLRDTTTDTRAAPLPPNRTRALPQSSPIRPSAPRRITDQTPSSPILNGSTQYKLRRSSSSFGRDSRSATPTLKKKASVSSIQGSAGGPSSRPPSRRSSSAAFPSSPSSSRPISSMGPFPEQPESSPAPTAASVAKLCFEKELILHDEFVEGSNIGNAIVILQDACYGHRYSRPRTSKASLSTIVERPERIHATILGISAAYVRLGERHSTGGLSFNPKRYTEQTSSLPFRIQKSTRAIPLNSAAVTSVHGTEWMQELSIMCNSAASKLALNGKELARPDTAANSRNESEKPRLHEGDLYLCKDSLDALEGCIGAVFDGVDRIFAGNKAVDNPPKAFVCIRPPGHHCSASYPSGFCWLNNVHIGITYAAMNYGLTHAAIIDFDLHHGDGSQAIAWDHNSKVSRLPKNAAASKKTAIGYYSIHDINSYPCEMGDEEKVKNASLCLENAHGQNIWNVHLQPWKHDVEFSDLYEQKYLVLLEKARAFLRAHTEKLLSTPNSPAPRAAIFLSAGFDASEWEGAGMQRHKVNVPTDFYARFTSDVVRLSEEEGLSVEGRILSVLEGGYSSRALASGVMSHISGLAGTTSTPGKIPESQARLGKEMGDRLGNINDVTESFESLKLGPQAKYDCNWWALKKLEELEELVDPPPPPAVRKPRTTVAPTYTTPTQSSTAKVVSSPQIHRVSSIGGLPNSPRTSSPRAPSPPPPDVSWATAAHELSKVLIPSDRQTKSHRPEDLSVEASRVKKEKPVPTSHLNDSESAGGKRQLRDRRAKAPNYAFDDIPENNISRADRRRTVAVTDLAAKKPDLRDQLNGVASRTRRRSSAASSVSYLPGEEDTTVPPMLDASSVVTSRPSSSSAAAPASLSSTPGIAVPNETAIANSKAPSFTRTNSTKARTAPKKQLSVSGSSTDSIKTKNTTDQVASSAINGNQSVPAPSDDLDGIAASMKKMTIKLKVPPRGENDAREKKKLSEKKPPVARAPRKPAAPRAPKVNGAKKAVVKPSSGSAGPAKQSQSSSTTSPVDGDSETQPAHFASAENMVDTRLSNQEMTGLLPISPATDDIVSTHPPALVSQDSFIPYEVPQPVPHPPINQEPLIWLPPNTSTPQANRRANLPAFTSSSPIPFGKRAGPDSIQPAVNQQPTFPMTNSSILSYPGSGATADFDGGSTDRSGEDDIFKVPSSSVKR